MGHSYSPRNAQALAWAALLKQATAKNGLANLEKRMRSSEHPPAFGILRNEKMEELGIIFIWYDNFVVLCADQLMTTEMSKALKKMSESDFVWGEKALFHPTQLEQLVSAVSLKDEQQKWACVLGLQFGLGKRDAQGKRMFQWRLKPSTAEKAELLRRQLRASSPLSCRMISRIIGSGIWHAYVAGTPLLALHDLIEISQNVAVVVARTKKLGCSLQPHGGAATAS